MDFINPIYLTLNIIFTIGVYYVMQFFWDKHAETYDDIAEVLYFFASLFSALVCLFSIIVFCINFTRMVL